MGPTQTALAQLWAQHRRNGRRLWSPAWRRELALRARFDLEMFAPETIANQIAPGTVPDCPNCPDLCCAGVTNTVSLRLVDVATLIDLGRTSLMTRTKPRFPLALQQSRPHLATLQTSMLWRQLPVMRQIGPQQQCAALGPDRRCTLYPSWPTSCERFPYQLDALRKQIHWGTRCPQPLRHPQYEKRSAELHQAAVRAYNERIKDAVLLTHARPALDALGLGAWLGDPQPSLPVVD